MHTPRSAFGTIASNFHGSVLSYREFLVDIGEHLVEVKKSDDEHLHTEVRKLSQGFSQKEIKLLKRILWSFAPRASGEDDAVETDDEDNRTFTSEETKQVPDKVLYAGLELHNKIRKGLPSENQQRLLHRSIITGIVGQFEVLLADVAHEFYRHAPRALEADEKVLSVSELKQFPTIEEAVDYVVSRKIDDLLRGSATDWQKFFATRMKLDLAEIAPDWQRFLEYIQRRHIIVHAGGRLSRRYLENVDERLLKEYFGDPQVGRLAKLSAQYCTECLDAFETVGARFIAESWLKLCADQTDEVEEFLDNSIYPSMLSGNWEPVLYL